MSNKIKWPLHSNHSAFGKCVMIGRLKGEEYRWFDKFGVISMIPLDALEQNENDEAKEMQKLQ